MTSSRSAFVLMPFKEPYNAYYLKIFKPALEAADYRVLRGDDVFTPRPVILDIQKSIAEAALVLCEMSERNPNVFYELGLAHAVGKPAILVSQQPEDIPFDLRHIRTIVYDASRPGWEKRLKRQITSTAVAATCTGEKWPPPLVPFDAGRLYTIIGLLNEDPHASDDPRFQSFKIGKSNKNPLANLWADPRPGNSVTANLVPGQSLLRIAFASADGCYSPAVGIHPEDLKARKVPDDCRWLAFQARLAQPSAASPEVRGLAIRLVNGQAQHWEYLERTGEREIFELNPGEWTECRVVLREPDRWRLFKGASNYASQGQPVFDVLASVIFELGCKRNARELGHGGGIVELSELILQ
jgi:hypothetical protein